MRQEILDYINTVNLGTFFLSTELPWVDGGVPLYLKNLKKIYVDVVEFSNNPLISALNGLAINSETSIVRLYFACDAKTLPSNYEAVVTNLKAGKDITTIAGVNARECEVTTDLENDVLVTTLEYRFTKIST